MNHRDTEKKGREKTFIRKPGRQEKRQLIFLS
jgi:hypothetical protein